MNVKITGQVIAKTQEIITTGKVKQKSNIIEFELTKLGEHYKNVHPFLLSFKIFEVGIFTLLIFAS